MMATVDALISEIAAHGDRGAVVPFARVGDLKKDMLELKNGVFHTGWLDRMVAWMTGEGDRFVPSDFHSEPRSLISVLMPSPRVRLRFDYRGGSVYGTVPPHYAHWEANNVRVLRYINDCLAPHGFSAVMAVTLPQKLLAVHCGLALYGRNNIGYSDDFGSYMQIMTYISDCKLSVETPWFPIRRMERCETCRACAAACPTGAIDFNRRLVDSDRCITYIDELPEPLSVWPKWMDENARGSLLGCEECQNCCPANARNKENAVEGAAFTEAETAEIMRHNAGAPYSDALAAKIASLGILSQYAFTDVLSRNLTALLKK